GHALRPAGKPGDDAGQLEDAAGRPWPGGRKHRQGDGNHQREHGPKTGGKPELDYCCTADGEFEESGGAEWAGKEGWELSEERLEKLRGRLATLRVLKLERAAEMIGLVVDCQKLFRELGPPVENPLQNKVCERGFPSLRTEAQTQTSVGLSVFNVHRLKKLREDMREDRELHTERKKEHRLQIESLWEKLSVPERSRQEHLAATKGITHSDMDELESELARLRKLKAEKLTDMLKAAREEVSGLLEVSVSPNPT
ncbi:unnamed protein product, partial [Ectocarpus fasciculatus]